MRIDVTRADIAEGLACNGRECPIARAVNRAAGGGDAFVGKPLAVIKYRGLTVEQPGRVRAFVEAFDSGRAVAPFAFDLPDGAE